MPRPQDKVDMVQMNAAIDKVLVVSARPKPTKQGRTQGQDRQSSSVDESKTPYRSGKR